MKAVYSIPLVAAAAAALALVRYAKSVTPTADLIVFRRRSDIPTMLRVLLVLLLGRKDKAARRNAAPPPAPILTVVVEEFFCSETELKEFRRLCGSGRAALISLLPHTLCQKQMFTLMTHAIFPVPLLGAVHARSVFE